MSDEVIVLSRTQIINVEPSSGRVTVTNAGPAGPPGPAGDGGDALWEVVSDTTLSIISSAVPDVWELDLFPHGGSGGTTGIQIVDLPDTPSQEYISVFAVGDVNVFPGNDFNVDAGRDVLITASHDLSLNSGTGYGIFLTSDDGYFKIDPSDCVRLVGQGKDVHVESVDGDNIYIQTNLTGVVRLSSSENIELSCSGPIIFTGVPTSASGLPSGAIWRDASAGNVLKQVP